MPRALTIATHSILAVLLLQERIAAEDSNIRSNRGHVEFIPELCTNESQVYRWVGQTLHSPEDWTVSPKDKAGECPPGSDQEPVMHAFCSGNFHPHWPHTTDLVYNCWYFFEKHPNAKKVMFSPIPNLAESLMEKMNVLNISVLREMPPPACTNDVVFQRRSSGRSGWHNDEPGSNFISVESASTLRRHLLRHLRSRGLRPRFSRAVHNGAPHHAPQEQIKIGILNRRGSRRLLNPELVFEAFANHTRRIEIHTLDDMMDLPTFESQCLWMNEMDIIISPHGAQLTNLVCALPCTVVVEAFSPQYFIPGFFNPFSAALRLETFGVYMGADGYTDTDACYLQQECQRAARLKHVRMPDVFRQMPPLLFNAWHKCCKGDGCHA
eukprot:GGOE01006057.1.p1 GENE.GGOE01006057.1~~GGOE01006057.1.p1  ORF type:complete len:381 (+),score=103.49 GGOE01006057.1:44-1186(+)